MSVLDVIRNRGPIAEANQIQDFHVQELRAQLDRALSNEEVLVESLADLELMLEDQGWERLLGDRQLEFSNQGLRRAASLCRVMAVGNPLIKRGLNVRQAYVFGDGVTVTARDPDVAEIVKRFWKDESNKASLTGSQAQEENERALGTDGNNFLACFTTPTTGRVEVRSIPLKEINDIITNPEDRDEPWYYERSWQQTELDSEGFTKTTMRKAYYPDIRYRPGPRNRMKRINGIPINWNAPIYHISVNRLNDWKFGVGDAFAAIAWARGYKEFLEDWATLVKALSRFAWRAQHKKVSGAQKLREKLARKPAADPETGRPLDSGGTFVGDDDATLEAIPKTGAVIDSDSGKPLAAMVASALELSLIILLTDPGATGARAVAETLDEPMIRAMTKRRNLWQEAFETIINYVINVNVRSGNLPGTEAFDRFTRRVATQLPNEDMRALDIVWPELGSPEVEKRVAAIVEADSTGKVPKKIVAKLLLEALGVEDVEDILKDMLDDNGNFKDPDLDATMAAVRRFRQGQDPAAMLNGDLEPEEEPNNAGNSE